MQKNQMRVFKQETTQNTNQNKNAVSRIFELLLILFPTCTPACVIWGMSPTKIKATKPASRDTYDAAYATALQHHLQAFMASISVFILTY